MNKIGSDAAGGCKVLVIIIIAVAKPTASANDHHDVPNNKLQKRPTTPENKCPPITLRGLAKALSGIVIPMAQLAANEGIIKSLPDNTDK